MVVIRELTLSAAIREAIFQEMKRDDRVFVMGENIGMAGGEFRVTDGFYEEFGQERVRDTPLAEAGFVGAGVGAAMIGMKPVVDCNFSDFVTIAMDQIVNQAAKLRYMSGGQVKIPVIVRMAMGAFNSSAAHHSQCLYSMVAHIPGLKVVVPSTSYDAKGLMISSIRGDDPVLFFEHKALYFEKFGHVPEEPYEVPLGKAEVKRKGEDVTIVATALMVRRALAAAEQLDHANISLEILDPRTIVPLDKATIIDSVRKTGRLVVVDEDYERCGFASEIAAIVAEEAFDLLDAPIRRVATPNTPIPFSPILENAVIPSVERIVKTVREIV